MMPYYCITGSQTTEGQNVQEEITFIHNKKYNIKHPVLHYVTPVVSVSGSKLYQIQNSFKNY
jgi:hypothetical protein